MKALTSHRRPALRKALTGLSIIATAGLLLSGCAAAHNADTGSAGHKFKIGYANSRLSQPYLVQRTDAMIAATKPYVAAGIMEPLIVEANDSDTQGQIALIQNLINQKVDAIIVDPSSPTALNPILTQAQGLGIKLLAIDDELQMDGVPLVTANFPEVFDTELKWLAEQTGSKGDLMTMNGIAGYTAFTQLDDAVSKALKAYPNFKQTGNLICGWDQATAVSVTQSWLASGNRPDAVMSTGGGCAAGILQAFVQSGVSPLPPMTGEPTVGWVNLAAATLKTHPEFKPFTANFNRPVGVGEASIHTMVDILQGDKVKSGTLYVPGGQIDPSNFADYVAKAAGKPDSYTLDIGGVTKAEVKKLFFK